MPIKEKSISTERSPDIQMHIDDEHETGGHWCAKIIFFVLLSALIGLVALIILENRGINDVAEQSTQQESRFSEYFQGWIEEPKDHDDDHDAHQVEDHDDEHDDEEEHDLDEEGPPFSEENLNDDERVSQENLAGK